MTRSGKPFDESRYTASRGPELLSKLQATMRQARLLHAELLNTITELEQDDIAGLTGYARLPNLIAEVLHVAPSHARRWIKQAEAVAERLTPPGTPPPRRSPTSGPPSRTV